MKTNKKQLSKARIRLLGVMLVFLLILPVFTGCMSKEAKKADALINSIGTVSLDSEEKIIAAEKAYDALTSEQKEEIKDYDKLLDARAEFDRQTKEHKKEQARLFAESHSIVPDVMLAKIARDGSAYFPLGGVDGLRIEGDIADARLSADRQTVIVLTDDGHLYYAPKDDPKNKTDIASNVYKISAVRPNGLIYETADKRLVRYTFPDGESVEIGTDLAGIIADDNLSILVADTDGNILVLSDAKKETERIASYSGRVRLVDISDDASICVWAEVNTTAKTHTIYCYKDGQADKLATIDNENSSTSVCFNEKQTFVVVADTYLDALYYMHVGDSDLTKVRLGNTLSISSIYTDDGPLQYDTREQIDGIYVLIDSDEGDELNFINKDGRETLVTKIDDLEIANGYVFYTKTNNSFYYGKLQGYENPEADRIDRDVKLFEVSVDGQYIYYFNDTSDDGTGSLHRYCREDDSSKLISSKAFNNYYSSLGFWGSSMYLTSDGAGIFFYESAEENVDGTYTDIGSLKYSYIDKETVRIDNEIIVSFLSSGLARNYIDPSFLIYEKYVKVVGDKEVICDLVVYDGESHTIAESVQHSKDRNSSVHRD